MDARAAAGLVLAMLAAGVGLVVLAPDGEPHVATAGGSDPAEVETAQGTVEIAANAGAGGTSATAYRWTAVESPLGNVTGALVEAVYSSETSQTGLSRIRLSVGTTETLNETTVVGDGEVTRMRIPGDAFDHTAGADMGVSALADDGSVIVDETVDVHVTVFRNGAPDWTGTGLEG